MSTNLNNSYQNALRNMLSLSLTMYFDNLWSLNTSLKNNFATCATLYYEDMEKKFANLVNRSTTTYMQSMPCTLGKPVMKSMDMLSHFYFGMGNGCSNPTWDGSTLTCSNDKSHTPSHASIHHPLGPSK
jgi:hypothetical protein